jgi:hypothetical protein
VLSSTPGTKYDYGESREAVGELEPWTETCWERRREANIERLVRERELHLLQKARMMHHFCTLSVIPANSLKRDSFLSCVDILMGNPWRC